MITVAAQMTRALLYLAVPVHRTARASWSSRTVLVGVSLGWSEPGLDPESVATSRASPASLRARDVTPPGGYAPF